MAADAETIRYVIEFTRGQATSGIWWQWFGLLIAGPCALLNTLAAIFGSKNSTRADCLTIALLSAGMAIQCYANIAFPEAAYVSKLAYRFSEVAP